MDSRRPSEVSDALQRPSGEQALPFSPAAGCLISFLVAIIPACLLLTALALAVRGELTYRLGPVREWRVWLVREGSEQGLGYSNMTRAPAVEKPGEACFETHVYFILWKSMDIKRQAVYCDCFAQRSSGWALTGACP